MVDLLDDDSLLNLRKRRSTTDPLEATKEIRANFHTGPATNEALEAWKREQAAKQEEPSTSAGPRTCRSCGTSVTAKDHWVMLGLCKSCVGEEKLKQPDRLGQVEDTDWLLDE